MNHSIVSVVAMRARRAAVLGVAIALGMLAGAAHAQLVDISSAPLYGGRQPHPNVVVTTSVEFPSVGAAYLAVPYVRTATYVGYFDAAKCYQYTTSNSGYFYTSATAVANVNHECSNAFSGNFMNWVTMSAIDEFRYAITGGNRDDENGPNNGTIIQRAYLPDGTVPGVPNATADDLGFYGYGNNFPRHAVQGSTIDGYTSSASTAILPVPSAYANAAIYITNCKTFVFFGSQPNGNCRNPANDYGQALFGSAVNVRVNVCDSDEGPVRTDLCLQYGGTNGKYKPVGQAQINAGRMRFAAFGYLMDRTTTGYTVPSGCADGSGWSRCRYGGVLRAPMKYIGPTTFDAGLVASPNSKAEVNANGTLNRDPEGTALSGSGYSGFINYINKFGSTGVYKRYDPAGELFYEAIRYYQNLGPTAQAAQGTYNDAVKDNFPLTTTWTDPIGSVCSANYIVNLSDANTWDDTYLPGYNGSPSAGYGRPSSRPIEGGLDAYAWTANIGLLESTTNSIASNDVRPGLANIATQNTANSASWAVAGAAYWANVNDVRPDLAGKQTIKTISFDVAEPSNTVQDRQLYLMGKYGGFNNVIDRPTDTFANPFWGPNPANPAATAIRTNSEWEDAVGSAYPANYLLASDPQKLINGLRAAFARINSQTGTLSGAALTSANLTYGSAGAYIATFDPARWSGSVLFNSLSVDSSGNLVVSAAPLWDSGSLLSARCGTVASGNTTCKETDTSVNKRNIVTTVAASGVRTAIPFTWSAINAADVSGYANALNSNPSTNAVDGNGQARVDYLRGYRGDEAFDARLPLARFGDGRHRELGARLRRSADVRDSRRRLPGVLHRQRGADVRPSMSARTTA